MIKIGDFSRISRTSIKALRYYDEVGLLRPAHVDNASGYRYYSGRQLPVLSRIIFFKKLGFPLREIKLILTKDASVADLRRILEIRRADLLKNLREQQLHLREIDTLLKRIQIEDRPSSPEVFIRTLEPRRIASLRSRLAGYTGLDGLLSRLQAGVPDTHREAGCGAIWHRCLHADDAIDCEAFVTLTRDVPPARGIRVRNLPPTIVASFFHDGPEETLSSGFASAIETINSYGYEVAWPMQEFYFSTAGDSNFDVTEVQFPIRLVQRRKSRLERVQ